MRISVNASAIAWCRRFGHVALIGLFASTTWADSLPSRVVQESPAHKASAEPTVLLGNTTVPAARFELTALPPSKAQIPSSRQQKYLPVGVGRTLPWPPLDLAALPWSFDRLGMNGTSSGTLFTTLEWQSPGAAAVRLHLSEAKLPAGIRLYLYGTANPERLYGPYSAADLQSPDGTWLPVVDGDTVRVEIQARIAAGAPQGRLSMATLSHLRRSIRGDLQKSLTELGDSGSCNIDIACPPSDAQWRQYGQSVAKYYLTDAIGDTAICTGTLLNSASPEPLPNYFLTAAHCVSTPAVAASMQFFWFFQRATCGGPAPTSVTETFNGATFLRTVSANDMTLVRLNAPPPAGATRAGWNSSAITAGDTVMALHHPSGDLKKFSRGTDQGFTDYASTTPNSAGTHIHVLWNAGTTEGGSSGSGLFNEAGELVGTLDGGAAACGVNQSAPDWYGRFDQAYASLRTYLMPSSGPTTPPPGTPAPVVLSSGETGSSAVTANNSLFFSIATRADSTRLTVSLTPLDADADLYVYRGARGGIPATCASTTPARAAETCVIDSPGAATWFIEVKGNDSTSFMVTPTVDYPAITPTITPTITQEPPSGRRRGGGGSMTTQLLGVLALLALIRTWRTSPTSPRRGWRALLHCLPMAALAATLGCAGTPAAADPAATIVLEPLTAAEVTRLAQMRKDKLLMIGIGREVPVADRAVALERVAWTRTAKGVATTLSIRSPDAQSLRVALLLSRDYPGLQVAFRGRGGQLASSFLGPDLLWSPTIAGDTVIIDLVAPTAPPAGVVLEVPRVSHQAAAPTMP